MAAGEVLGEIWAVAGGVGPVDVRVFVRGITGFRYLLTNVPRQILAEGVPLSSLVIQNLGSISIEIGNGRDLQYGEGLRIPPNALLSNGQIVPGGGVLNLLERFARAGLPAPVNAGRLVGLTDYDRSVWLDDGVQFFSLTGEIFNVKAFDAKGDGVTDDQAAIAAAISALLANPTGGVLYFPPGTYKVSVSPVLTDPVVATKKIGVWGYGATITTVGAIYGFTLRRIGNRVSGPVVQGLTINQRGNATALGGFLLEGVGLAHLVDCNVIADGTNAGYVAGIHIRNQTPADNNTGNFWGHLENCTVTVLDGADPVIPVGVIFEGGANSWLVTGGTYGSKTGFLIRNQVNATETTPNSITIIQVDFENGVANADGVVLDATGRPVGQCAPGVKLISNRYELSGAGVTSFLRITGATSNAAANFIPYLAGNTGIGATQTLALPAGILVTNLDNGIAVPVANQGAVLASRRRFSQSINVLNAVAGTYVAFPAGFSLVVDLTAQDLVRLFIIGTFRKNTGGFAQVVFDRGGAKLPVGGGVGGSPAYVDNLGGPYIPYSLEAWDAPGAGNFTYVPQLYTNDANQANAINQTTFVLEVWR